MLATLRGLVSGSGTSFSRGGYAPIACEEGAVAVPPAPRRARVAITPDLRTREGRDVYLCFWALGAGILLPWNALICTFPLLASMFTGPMAANLPSYVGTVYCFANLFLLGLAQRNAGKSAPTARLRWSLLLLLATAIALTFPLIPVVLPRLSDAASPLLLPVVLAVTILLSLSSSYLQSAVFGLAALWGSSEMLAVMSGQGGIAVVVSGVQLALAVVDSSRTATSPEDTHSTLAAEGLWALAALGAVVCLAALKHLTEHPDYIAVLAPLVQREEISGKRHVMRRVFFKNIRLEVAVAFVFVVTLSIFPPITTTIKSVQDPPPWLLQPAVFIAAHFVIFNIGDYVGRTYAPSIPGALQLKVSSVLLLSFARVVFFPLFLLCNTPTRAESHSAVLGDWAYLLVLLLFGLTNGGVSCIIMIKASSPQLNPAIADEERDLAGTLAAFSLVFGLAVGSLSSFAVNYAINGSLLS